MRNSHTIGRIVGGFLFILALAVVVFTALIRFMSGETERDVSEIAQTYLEAMAREELDSFDMFADFRYSQTAYIKNLAEDYVTAEEIARTMERAAAFQEMSSCGFIDASGRITMAQGSPILAVEDTERLVSRLQNGENAVSSGYNETEQLILWAVPASLPLEDGGKSIGIVCGRRMETFAQKMKLNHQSTLSYYYIIRKDGSYLQAGSDPMASRFLSRILLYAEPKGMSAEEAVMDLLRKMEQQDIFTMSLHYEQDGDGTVDNRSVLGVPIPGSEWYLITVLPYGVLDQAVERMGNSRLAGMVLAMAVLTLGLLGVFCSYLRMTRRQIAELEAVGKAAEQARQDAEEANKAKSEFLSNMSHDIRTPMNAIVGMTAIASAHIDNAEQVKDCLRKITLSGKHLLGLINDVLDMSKIESGKLTLNMEVLSLRETMETICNIIRPQIAQRKQTFDAMIGTILSEYVYCDSVRMNQVLINFLGNAVKFTPQGGRITVSLWQEESPKGGTYVRTYFQVADTGVGMSEEYQKKIFEAFSREDNLRIHKTEGTGLGMAITKYIVDAMGGVIDVESQQGKGSTFRVTVDLKRAEDVRENGGQFPPWRILVADDNEDVRASLVDALCRMGTRAEGCPDGETAVTRVKDAGQDAFFAVLADYQLTGIDGVETARRIRESAPETKVLLISARDQADFQDAAVEAGICGFLTKPVFESNLWETMSQLFQDAQVQRETEAEPAFSVEGLRILLAEDNELNTEIATTILSEYGATVEHGEDGKATLEMFSQSPERYYDVILMDLRMPNMNGFEATRAIRSLSRPDAKTVPIIAMSADAFADDVQRCLDAGMNGHVAKPIDIDLLMKTLSKFL